MAKNSVFHLKAKHVDTKYHFIRSLVVKGIIKPQFCPSKDQTLVIFTEPLGKQNSLSPEMNLAFVNINFWIKGEC